MKVEKKKKKNPLSHARGKQKRPESVWFRRSGAGFRLFVQYYTGQPIGTISELPEGDNLDQTSATLSGATSGPGSKRSPKGQGQSRASKRRKRKKSKKLEEGAEHSNENIAQVQGDGGVSKETFPQDKSMLAETSDFRLIQELEKFIGRNSKEHSMSPRHLRPCLEALSKPLPLTFRLRKQGSHSAQESDVSSNQEDVATLLSEKYSSVVSPTAFDKDIYQGGPGVSKEALSSICAPLKRFLIKYSQNGALARQELGSMLPVLALEITGNLKPAGRVIDMCASPGSKTLQALEIIAGSGSGKKGRIVANDVLESRLTSLEQAVQRSGMDELETRRITYTCQDATKLALPVDIVWDTVICDVPCSGDGTCRKDKHILPMWKPNHGNELHGTQLKILLRALELVKVGGVVCYSTCSLNPVENEAVVAAALKNLNDHKDTDSSRQAAIELVEFPSLPGFIRRQGIKTWRVADFTEGGGPEIEEGNETDREDEVALRWYSTQQDAVDDGMESPLESMWPPQDDIVENMNLDRCTRLWPQDHDTGGFFLTLIRKNREIS